LGVRAQFRTQGEAACRALFLEVRANYDALAEMVKVVSSDSGWPTGKPNPGWLHRSIWDAQVPYVAQLLDERTLELVVRAAYATLDSVPEMRVASSKGLAVQICIRRALWPPLLRADSTPRRPLGGAREHVWQNPQHIAIAAPCRLLRRQNADENEYNPEHGHRAESGPARGAIELEHIRPRRRVVS